MRSLPALPQGRTVQRTIDSLGRVSRTQVAGPTPVDFFYDSRGRLAQTQQGTRSSTFSYFDTTDDQRGRLIGVAEGPTVLSQYDYDDNGNRLSHTTPGGTDTGAYDAQDRLLSYGDFTFTYGENGELRTKTDTVTSDVTTYVYDARGSLRSVTLPDTTVIDYVIDGQGRRVGKKVDGALVQGFLYKDQLRIAAELDSAGEVVAQFSYVGGSHSPDWMMKGGALYRFIKDQVGSVRLVVDALSGDVVQELDYDGFGVVLSDSNPGFQPFGFAGGLYDGDTGLTRFGARDYDAGVGRWTSKDPIRWRGGQNLALYAHADPVNYLDPTGAAPGAAVIAGGVGLAAAAAVVGWYYWTVPRAALDETQRRFPDDASPEANAFRHCLWSCYSNATWGSGWTQFWTDWWEGDDASPDSSIDRANNACGMGYGDEPDLDPWSSCQDRCSAGLGNGDLQLE